jgi:hypothetical protein
MFCFVCFLSINLYLMVVKTEPMPFVKGAFHYGARSAREEALLKGLEASKTQAEMNRTHSGGAMTVPQFHTGMTQGPMNPNVLSAKLNQALTQNDANGEFDTLALANSVKKGGSRHRRKTIKRKRRTTAHKKRRQTSKRR